MYVIHAPFTNEHYSIGAHNPSIAKGRRQKAEGRRKNLIKTKVLAFHLALTAKAVAIVPIL
ncbi:hypothetical protein NIES2119_14180 [[Phormidium ambiguum] IAM M-71]|uniref:Uncharacterized protein n=1 Tax=[Phormidium ambiguum] IAM M-71 TaxID=454136 RepID=A0A1U7IJM0_9CYAN|nr:hypothetical protein [Phormidium ambiguum]OKH37388.1 hypothetical protein NIES2119_14180 [Phormidium ambiguum IAM M-71]